MTVRIEVDSGGFDGDEGNLEDEWKRKKGEGDNPNKFVALIWTPIKGRLVTRVKDGNCK